MVCIYLPLNRQFSTMQTPISSLLIPNFHYPFISPYTITPAVLPNARAAAA